MKIANLLAQYLYAKHRLDLPGIGSFFLDPTAITEAETSKTRTPISSGIRFEHNSADKDISDLVSFISSKTGKMKSLAMSDLESHLELAKQFLNIGKPFTFDGIGNLMRLKPGEYEFAPEQLDSEKFKDNSAAETQTVRTTEDKYESFLTTPRKPALNKSAVAMLVVVGIALAIWGGYMVASRDSDESGQSAETTTQPTTPVVDTLLNKPIAADTVAREVKPDRYKYILEVANAKRAFRRYNMLRDIDWDVKMETNDSVQFKLYMLLPARPDTTKVLDSLTALSGRRVRLEYPN